MVHLPGASALYLLSASSVFVKLCMIQNKGPRGHRREVLHVRRNHGITAIVERIGRPLGVIFIIFLLKNTALLPVSVECIHVFAGAVFAIFRPLCFSSLF